MTNKYKGFFYIYLFLALNIICGIKIECVDCGIHDVQYVDCGKNVMFFVLELFLGWFFKSFFVLLFGIIYG